MLGAVLRAQNEPLALEELPEPRLDVGQVRVEVKYSGICGAQIREITGRAGPDKYLPHLLGHEGSGIVVGIGPGVKTVRPGDHVVMHWRKGDGIEADPPRYGEVGAGPVATWGTEVIVSENRVTAIPKHIPLDVAALFGCAMTTGLGVICNDAQLKFGQDVLVIGTGGVGLAVIQGAALAGARRIVANDLNRSKEHLTNLCGARKFIPALVDIYEKFDLVVDCTGIGAVISRGLQLVKDGGKMILIGQPARGNDVVIKGAADNYRGITIMDSQGGGTIPQIDIPRYMGLWTAGMIEPELLITDTHPLSEINAAVDAVKNGEVMGRCLIQM